MQDDKRWQEILAAPSSLVTGDLTLEWAISESLRKTFGLSKESCAIAMQEYRKFRYLCDIADGPLLPSPLITFVQARDTPNSSAFTEIKRWSVRAAMPHKGSLFFVHNPAYQRAVDLYQQEFAGIPARNIWPTRLQARRRNQAFVALGMGVAVATMGDWAQSGVAIRFGIALAFLAIGSIIFIGRHWGDPQGDA
ncbi:glycine-rich domain-containing protein [Cypionkella psychrotolerans]|uniref:hypothetical protein n=1 Tax=Cypionkella psychrotolerans TaxID=1678131 RepID=UPI000A739BCD|nr:hypothetical protein [Cypionkella psychrotolerans]